MRKVDKDIIEIKTEVTIGKHVLEVGDKIKILKEGFVDVKRDPWGFRDNLIQRLNVITDVGNDLSISEDSFFYDTDGEYKQKIIKSLEDFETLVVEFEGKINSFMKDFYK